MINDLLKYLPHILPTRTPITSDKVLEITSRHFKIMYSNTILELLWHIDALPQSAKYIKKSCLKDIIAKVTLFIKNYCDGEYLVWQQNGTIKVKLTKKMKQNGKKTSKQLNPADFMVEAKKEPQFKDRCIVGMTIQSLLILFDKLLSQVRTIEQNEYFDLNVSRLFCIVDATTQVDNFCYAFMARQPYAQGANKSAQKKQYIRSVVKEVVNSLHISSNDAMSLKTIYKVRQKAEEILGKPIRFSDKTLQNHIIDFAGHTDSN